MPVVLSPADAFRVPTAASSPYADGGMPGCAAGEVGNTRRTTPKAQQRFLPVLVGLCIVLIQLLLLVRFCLLLLGFSANIAWVGIIFTLSSIFVLPFRLLLQSFTARLPLPRSIELFTLLAILIYGLLSRILVRLLKALLR